MAASEKIRWRPRLPLHVFVRQIVKDPQALSAAFHAVQLVVL